LNANAKGETNLDCNDGLMALGEDEEG
ncbi:hypothetical protein A2U01_0106669, partial [Trifolium medium]|nr:hypothetical protein [Trifolium medium]